MHSRDTIALWTIIVFLAGAPLTLVPSVAEGQVANFVFTTDPRTVKPGAVSEQITVQAQGSGEESTSIPQTGCLSLTSTSQSGQFSSNASNWNSVSVLTMNRNTSNRSFYYKDSLEGTHTLTVKVALKPEDESRSCASWPVEEWGTTWTVTQSIIISGESTGTQQSEQSSTQTSTQGSAASSAVSFANDLVVDGGSDRVAIAGAGVQFSAHAYRAKEVLGNASFMWNFGDGSTVQGASVVHRFEYPGRYAVVVTGSRDSATGSDHFTVTVERAQLTVRALTDGSFEIENLSGRDVDLSRWIVQFSGVRFVLPDNTSVLAKQTIRISPNTLHFYAGSTAELDYPDGTLAFRTEKDITETSSYVANTVPEPAPNPISPPVRARGKEESGTSPKQETVTDEEEATRPAAEIQEQGLRATSSNVAAAANAGAWKWWLGALAISALAGGTVFVSRRIGRKEWNIIEE